MRIVVVIFSVVNNYKPQHQRRFYELIMKYLPFVLAALFVFWKSVVMEDIKIVPLVSQKPELSTTIATVNDSLPYTCECYNFTEDYEVIQIECRCFGKSLEHIPTDLNETVNKLSITDCGIKYIKSDALNNYRVSLQDVFLENLPRLRIIEKGSFANISNLRTLYISHAPQLMFVPGLLYGVTSKKFYSLRIVQTSLHEVPDLSLLPPENVMFLLDLDHNKIQELPSNSIKIRAEQVTINFNEIARVDDYAFNGSQIGKLNLRGNRRLTKLMKNAFKGLLSLRELDLSETSIEALPVTGLGEIETLRIQKTSSMTRIPSIYDFPNLQVAKLTYPFHCCAFKYPEQHDPERHAKYEEHYKSCHEGVGGIDTGQISTKTKRKKRNSGKFLDYESFANWGSPTDVENEGIEYQNFPFKGDRPTDWPLPYMDYLRELYNSSDWTEPLRGRTIDHQAARPVEDREDLGTFHPKSAEISKSHGVNALCGNFISRTPSVKCYPEPNALNPCEDIMGSSWLRISVWFVVVLAVVGNLAVITVILFSGGEVTVSRFLICNLAFADFCMGLYLMLIACMDLHSVGTYFNFAFDWQYGLGCQMAGFLTVFASHLSIFTLTVVTLERWFAITYAIHLTRRIRIGAAAKTMIGGWLYSFLIATLPLLGVSNYSSTSICLPMEVNTPADKAYLYTIILLNGVAFLLIVFCYAQIYLSLGYETRHCTTKGEMTIAKKMALLIFTDFATWAPIAFFAITALAGYPLIGVTRSKILLVFFYPLNACANPYLYALMTAQYRRDLFVLISRCGVCKKTAQQYTVTTTLPVSNNSHPVPLLARTNGHNPSTKANEIEDAFV